MNVLVGCVKVHKTDIQFLNNLMLVRRHKTAEINHEQLASVGGFRHVQFFPETIRQWSYFIGTPSGLLQSAPVISISEN